MSKAKCIGVLVVGTLSYVSACSDSTGSPTPDGGNVNDASMNVEETSTDSSAMDAATDVATDTQKTEDAAVDGGPGGCLIAGPTCQCLTPNPSASVYSEANCSKIGSTIYCCASEVKTNGVNSGTACACYTAAATRDQAKAAWTAATGAITYSNVRDATSCP